MRTSEEVPEFILGVPAFRKYFVNFHMPTPAQNQAEQRSDSSFASMFFQKKSHSHHHQQHSSAEFSEYSRSEVQDRGITIIEHDGTCNINGKPSTWNSQASSLMAVDHGAGEEETTQPLLLEAMMFPKPKRHREM